MPFSASRSGRVQHGVTQWQRDLAIGYDKIGDGAGGVGPERGGKSLAVLQGLAGNHKGNAAWQLDLSISYEKVGDALVATGKREEALKAYRDGLAVRQQLADSDKGNARWLTDLVVGLYKVSRWWNERRRAGHLRRRSGLLKRSAREGKLTAAQQNWPELLRAELAKLPSEAGAR